MTVRGAWLLVFTCTVAACWSGPDRHDETVRLRSFTAFRQLHGEEELTVQGQFNNGSLEVMAGNPAELYRIDLTYPPGELTPTSDYDAANGTLLVGFPSGDTATNDDGRKITNRVTFGLEDKGWSHASATLALSPKVDLALDLALGVVEADLELGGLRISSFDVRAGTSETKIRFSKPNGIPCKRARVSGGVNDIALYGLGNSRCEEIKFQGAVGSVLLDFGGTWTSSAAVRATISVGALTLRLPRKIGIRLTMDKLLGEINANGLIRKDDAYVSPNYDTATTHLDLDLTTTAGGVTVEWIDADD